MFRLSQIVGFAATIAVCSSPVFAHTGHEIGHTAIQGFLHPLSGIDHILAMVSVGVLAFCVGGRAIWSVPLAFVLMMAVGGALGAAGVELPGVEQGIAASVLILGALIAAAIRVPLLCATVLVGAFAVFHGIAHGLEAVGNGVVPSSYFLGFIAATIALHGAGIALGVTFNAAERTKPLQRAAGAVVGLVGLVMVFG
jgi:urease accessory protein